MDGQDMMAGAVLLVAGQDAPARGGAGEPGPRPAATPLLRLCISGAASAHLLSRVIDLLAQRSLMPELVQARVEGERMTIRIELAAAPGPKTDALVEKLRCCVPVAEVRVDPPCGGARSLPALVRAAS